MEIGTGNKNSVNVPLCVIMTQSTPTYTLVPRLVNSSHERKSVTEFKAMLYPVGEQINLTKCCLLPSPDTESSTDVHHSIRLSASESKNIRRKLTIFMGTFLDVK